MDSDQLVLLKLTLMQVTLQWNLFLHARNREFYGKQKTDFVETTTNVIIVSKNKQLLKPPGFGS